jgi:hypothetical protein
MEAIEQETDNSVCGLVKEVIQFVLNEAFLDLALILKNFNKVLSDAMGEAANFANEIADLVAPDIKLLDMNMLNIMGVFLQNLAIFAVPIACTGLLLGVWVMSMFFTNMGDEFYNSVAMIIFTSSISNILIHNGFMMTLKPMEYFEMPYIRIYVDEGDDFYLTQLCSLLNLMSSIVFVLNTKMPIPGVLKD